MSNKNAEIIGLINGEITHFEPENDLEQKVTLTVSNIIAEGVELQSNLKDGNMNDKAVAIHDIDTMRHRLKATKPKNQSNAWFKLERWTEILGERCPLVVMNIGLYNYLILMTSTYIDVGEVRFYHNYISIKII